MPRLRSKKSALLLPPNMNLAFRIACARGSVTKTIALQPSSQQNSIATPLHMSGCGVPCGMVVVEERDARGSSLRRSRRTGTLVHATPCSGAGGPVALELVGDAGTETYLFRRGSCSLFRSFVHQGKLTVCTAGMRQQVTSPRRQDGLGCLSGWDTACFRNLFRSFLSSGSEVLCTRRDQQLPVAHAST